MGAMGRVTRSFALSEKLELPNGWRTIVAHRPKDDRTSLFYISPTGKRFFSLEAAKTFITDSLEAEDDFEDLNPTRKRKRSLEVFHSDISEEQNNNKINQDSEIKVSPEIKRRRKQMSMRNPLKNLLMRTLKKTHARNLKYEMMKASQTSKPKKRIFLRKIINANMRKN